MARRTMTPEEAERVRQELQATVHLPLWPLCIGLDVVLPKRVLRANEGGDGE